MTLLGERAASVATYRLDDVDVAAVDAALDGWADRDVDGARVAARRLPEGLLRFLDDFRVREQHAVAVVTGLPVDDRALGPTPEHWRRAERGPEERRAEAFLVALASWLGDVFSWATLQGGALVHDVVPIEGDENEQSGHGSEALLEWHTEDAFHPWRCDYLGLMALRNHDRVPTQCASITDVDLARLDVETLMKPRYLIRPDDEHLRPKPGLDVAATSIGRMSTSPEPTAVLFGDPADPYLRIDPYFMTVVDGDDRAERALRTLVGELERVMYDVALEAGDVCFVDNYRAVHGRSPFHARYDGTDRWLKKAVVTRDLRKSRASRAGASGRVVA